MIKRLLPYVLKNKVQLLFSSIFAVIGSTLALIAPFYIGSAVDKIIGVGNVDFGELFEILMLLLLMFCISGFFQWCVTTISTSITYKAISSLRSDAFNQINTLPISFFDQTSHGDVMSRMTNDIDAVSDGLLQGMTQLFMGIISLVGSIILMFRLNILITAVILIITPIAFLISAFIAKKTSKHFSKQSKTVGELNSLSEEIITNISLVKLYSLEKSSYDRFEKINSRLYTCGQKAQWYSSLINPTTRLINNFAYISVGVLGAFLVLHGEVYIGKVQLSGVMTVGLITTFLNYASQFARPINDITSVSTQLQGAVAALKRIFQIIDMKPETKDSPNNLVVTNGAVEFKDVSFSYTEDKPLISHLNLSVAPSSVVAIVGSTGAGKTTLVNLLMGFYEVISGKILIDNTDISTVNRDSLRSSFAMVLQDAVLFNGTVGENISYGKPDSSIEDIMAAAKKAHIHKAIMSLENGYDTVISNDDSQLSTGQKQLLTVARAMMLNPKMMILDEATSSVDTLTEIHIQHAFNKMMKGKTTFVIAHRLSTVKNADIILVMDKGNVVEKGTHSELMEKGKIYAEIFESQFKNK